MKQLLFASLFLCSFLVSAAHADTDVSELTDIQKRNRVLELAKKIVAAFEDEDPDATTFEVVRNKVNPIKNFYKLKRAFQLYSIEEPGVSADLVTIGAVSHTMETSSGPIIFIKLLLSGKSVYVAFLTASPLLSQMAPGIDALCIVLFGTYFASPEAQDLVANGRVFLVKGIKKTSDFTGLSTFFNKLISVEPAMERVAKSVNFFHNPYLSQWQQADVNEVSLMTDDGYPMLRIALKKYGENRLALKSLRFNLDQVRKENRSHLKEKISVLRGDIKDAVLIAFDDLLAKRYRKLANWHFVDALQVFAAGENCVTYQRDAEFHTACGCNHGGHHHESCDVTFTPLLQLSLARKPVENLPEGMAQITFKVPAIQMAENWHYHPIRALAAVPGCIGEGCLNTVDALVASPAAIAALVASSPSFFWRHRWFIPKAAWTAFKISKEVGVNTGYAAWSIGKTVGNAGLKCFQVLGKNYNQAPPFPY